MEGHKSNICITDIGTACCLIEFGEYRILTDTVLDAPGGWYQHGFGSFSKKVERPVLPEGILEDIDIILLSHPQHKDNFDTGGRAFAKTVPLILSTKRIEKKFRNGRGLKPWEIWETNPSGDRHALKIQVTPARHHPSWMPEFLSGEVIGFFIESDHIEESLYISGDTVFFRGSREVGERLRPTYSLLHVGSTQFRYLSGWSRYTMDARGFVRSVSALNTQVALSHTPQWLVAFQGKGRGHSAPMI